MGGITPCLLFKRQLYKMVKHIQTIRQLLPMNCLTVFDHFVQLALKGLNKVIQLLSNLNVCNFSDFFTMELQQHKA